jgi:hypothetical protein
MDRDDEQIAALVAAFEAKTLPIAAWLAAYVADPGSRSTP